MVFSPRLVSSTQGFVRHMIGIVPDQDGGPSRGQSQTPRRKAGSKPNRSNRQQGQTPRRNAGSRPKGSNRNQGQPSGRIVVDRGLPWDRPEAKRQILPFDKGN